MTVSKFAGAFTALALLATGTAPALASARSEQRSIAIEHADLDLGTEAGQAELERRIKRAAREVCGINNRRTGTRLPSASANACYQQALRDLRPQVARITGSGGGA